MRKDPTSPTQSRRLNLLHVAVLALAFVLPRAATAQLTSLSATEGLYEDRIVLTWTGEVPAGASIKIERTDVLSGNNDGVIAVKARTETEFVDRNVGRDTGYQYNVYFEDDGPDVEAVGYARIFPPIDIAATYNTREDGVLVTWRDRSAVESDYKVTRDGILLATTPANSGFYLDEAAVQDQLHTYCVFASDANGAVSDQLCADGVRAIVSAPGAVAASDGQYSGFVRITFADLSQTEDEYKIYSVDSEGNPALVGTVAGDATVSTVDAPEVFDDTSAPFGVPVQYCVFGVVGGLESAWVCDNGIRGLLPSPTNVTSSYDDYDDRIAITWQDASEVPDGYRVSRMLSSVETFLGEAGPAARSFSDETASQETEYTYCVTAFSTVDADSTFSNQTCSAPGRRTTVLPPTDVAATDAQYEDRVGIIWSDGSTTAMLFNVYRDGALVDNVPASTTFFVDDAGPANATVDYCVTAVSVSNGSFSVQEAERMIEDAKRFAGSARSASTGQTEAARAFDAFKETVALRAGTVSNSGANAQAAAMAVVETAPVCDPGRRELKAPTQLSASYDEFEDHVQLSWTDNSSAEAGYKIYRTLATGGRPDGGASNFVDGITATAASPTLTSFTLETWFRSAATTAEGILVSRTASSTYFVALNTDNNGGRIRFDCVPCSVTLSSTRGDLNDNRWHHVAVTYDAASRILQMFVDGVLDDTGLSPVPISDAMASFEILDFSAALSGLRLWDYWKSSDELRDGIQNATAADAPGTVYFWPFNDGAGSVASDLGPFANDFTFGGVLWELPPVSVAAPLDSVAADRQSFGDFTGAPGLEFVYEVRAFDRRGVGGRSARAVDEGMRTLQAPTAVQATDGTSESAVTVTWIDNSRFEKGYEVYLGALRVDSVGSNVTSTSLAAPDLGVSGMYAVRAVDAFGSSDAGSDVGRSDLLRPGDLNASTAYLDKVVLTWTDSSTVETGYRVTRDDIELATVAAGVTTYVDNAAGVSTYDYCVETLGANGATASACSEGRLATTSPASPLASRDADGVVNPEAGSGAVFDKLGRWVSIHGNTALVSGNTWDGSSAEVPGTGGAYFYTFDQASGAWENTARVRPMQGYMVITGVAVGADYAIVAGYDTRLTGASGYRAVFLKRTGTDWVEHFTYQPATPEYLEGVAIDGDRAVVAAWDATYSGAASAGVVHVLRREASTWVLEADLSRSTANDLFGYNGGVAMSGERLAVRGVQTGTTVYRRTGTSWNLEAQFPTTTCGACVTVDLDGDDLMIGGLSGIGHATAYPYHYTLGVGWQAQPTVSPADAAPIIGGGVDISVSGEYLLLTNAEDGTKGVGAGAAYVFRREGNVWTELVKLLPGGGEGASSGNPQGDIFGLDADIDAENLIIGAPGYRQYVGTAYILGLLNRPEGVAATDGTFDDRIQLTWSDVGANEDGFRVYRRKPDGSLDQVGTTQADQEVFDDFSALPGSAYDYCIAASSSEIAARYAELGESALTCDIGWRRANGVISGQISAVIQESAVVASTADVAVLGTSETTTPAGSSAAISISPSTALTSQATAAASTAADVCLAPNPNQALRFDGVGGYVDVENVPRTAQMSMCGWIKTNVSEALVLMSWANTNSGDLAFWQVYSGRLYYGEVGSGFSQIASSVLVNTGEWVRVCLVKDGATATMYVNGVERATGSGFTFPVATNTFAIGGTVNGAGASSFFDGAVDEVQIWDLLLTPAEIGNPAKLVGNESGLVAYWPFDQGNGAIAADLTSGRNHGTLQTGAYWVEGSPSGQCVRTDNNGNYTVRRIPYGAEGTFNVTPLANARTFSPAQKEVSLSIESPIENQVNFIDNTQLGVSGIVQFEGTSCPARDIQILVDSENRATTEADGTYSLSVFPSADPTDLYQIRPKATSVDASDITQFLPAKQDLFVDESLYGINFASLKKRVLGGYYGGSCSAAGYLGSAMLRVFTEDGCFDQTYPISGNFELELPPQKYLVQVTGVSDAPAGLSADMIRFFDDLGAQEVDLTTTADTLDLVYRPALLVSVAGMPPPPASCSAGLTADGRTLPNVPIIGRAQTVDLSISVLEDYGNGNYCPVKTGSVEVFDAIADKGGIAQVFSLDSTDGVIDYTTIGASPNTSQGALINGVDRSFQKSLTAVANVVGKSPARTTEWAIVEGLRPRTAEFVSATTEPFPILLLRDPPGGSSSAYIEKGVTNCQSLTNMHVAGGGAGAEINLALGLTVELSVGFGVELNLGTSGVALAVRTDIEAGRYNGSGDAIEICATTTEKWSTSDDPAWTGEDLYMGVALNLLFARADELKVDDPACSVDLNEVLAADIDPDDAFETTYVYGTTHIEKSLIPALEDLIALAGDPTLSGDPDGDGTEDNVTLTHALANWKAHLTNEDSLAFEALSDEANVKNISFSSGANYEYGTTFDSTKTWTETRRIYIKDATTLGVIVWALGVEQDFFAKFNVESEWTRDTTWTSGESRAMGYVLSDGDTGDFFSVDVGEDPRYGTPVFGIRSGRSSSPWEQGPGAVRKDGTRCGGEGDPCTQRRDWPEITVNPPVLRDVNPDGAGTFELTLTNRSENMERRQYTLAVPGELNPRNLGIKVTGGPLGGTRRETFTLEGGESRTINVDVSRISPTYAYEDVGFMLYPELDYAIWQGDPRTPFATSDTAFISVYFDAPCSDISILRPESPWYYNSASGPLEVLLDGFSSNVGAADSLVAVGVQYRRSGTPGWLLADSVHVGTIGQDATSWLDGLWTPPQDGNYELRAFSECVATEPGDNPPPVYSDVAEGTVDNKPPVVFGTPEPADQILTLGHDIAISFDEPVACESFITNGTGTNTTLSYASGPNQGAPIAGLQRVCDGRTVILAPPPSFDWAAAEGLVLEASIDDVTDLAGNELAGDATTWLFSVRRSAFVWSPANVDLDVTRGTEANITAQLVNGRATDAEFDLPMAFKLGSAAGDTVVVSPSLTTGTVVPGGTATVSFLIPDTLPLGEYSATLEATRVESGFAQEKIPFYVNANVVCAPPPSWTVNPAAFEYSMTLTALLNLSGVNSTDGNDLVVARAGNEIRGVAGIDDGRIAMVIYSNKLAGETIQFEVWDDSACTLFDETNKSFVFENNATQGTIADPAVIVAPYVADPNAIGLAAGWTWFSLNKTPVDASTAVVLADVVATPGDVVKYGADFSIYDEQFGWVGTLATVEPGPGYQIYVQQSNGFVPGGTIVDLGANPIAVQPGWNWIGYLPQAAQPVNDALQSLATATEGDVIKSQFGFAQFDAGAWYGSLSTMAPGLGYQLNVANAGTVTYTEPSSHASQPAPSIASLLPDMNGRPQPSAMPEQGGSTMGVPVANHTRTEANPGSAPTTTRTESNPGSAANPTKTAADLPRNPGSANEARSESSSEEDGLDPRDFETSMTVTATATIDGDIVLGSDGAVWVVDDRGRQRGVGRLISVKGYEQYRLFLMIYGHQKDESDLVVRTVNPENGEVVEVAGELRYKSGAHVGTIGNPVPLNLTAARQTGEAEEVDELPEEFALQANYPNPFAESTTIHYQLPQASQVNITIFDMLGREVRWLVDAEQEAGRYDLEFDARGLASGVYVYRMKAGDFVKVQRMTIVK